ncbi:PREDICTED: deoxynucleotidyltransferase terminal-interacting protein 2 [Gekko japonicus]|uniref:Deoxynucleotidyltransferase terminal-interacting protein 2 n=1 Tax=Gekko japonicus TaxID=146911 RepID=A0ABM1K541_GEKJA|nr:PREDICTED: deoxynucleotidyltransferase terminal-interacting protein 2 [Gekko japonicus]
MVGTRRVTRRSQQTPSSAGGNDSSMCPSMEGSTSVRATRSKSKLNSHPNIISESRSEKMKEPKTKPDIEEPLEVQATRNRSEATHLADSVAELQADGYVSEAESNCSSVSGLQTPMFIRVTRRRQIVIPCQLESPAKNRQSRRVFPSEDSKCQDDDLSESESCSSAVSGVQTSSTARMTRSRQVKANILPVCEAQAEEVSDAESWCSGVSTEPSVQLKRMTRSMRLRLQAETISQGERKSEVVAGDEKLPQHVTKSQTIVISDSEPTKSDFDEQQASCLSAKSHKQLSPCKPKYDSESVIGGDLKQRFSSSSKKTDRESTKITPEKEMREGKDCEIVDRQEEKGGKNKNIRESARKINDVYEIVDITEETCDQTSEKSRKATEKLSLVKSTAILSRQTTPSKGKCNTETQNPEEIIEVDKLHERGSPQNITPSPTIESRDDACRVSVVSIDSDGSQEEPVAESFSCATKRTEDEGCSTMSVFISDDSSESDSSDLEETNEMKMTASCAGSSKQNGLALDTSDSEVLFVIDKTPGLDSSKAYYLEEKDIGNDGEGTKSKTSLELEEDEEEFIDEDEGSLDVSTTALSLSSSIDPGLNLKDLGGLYINFDAGKQQPGSRGIVPLKEKKKDELLQKSTITPDFEKRECVPPLTESVYQLKKQRRAERAKTTGDGWFGMKAPEITEELKNDLQALKMRAAIDPKRFYKKNDREGLPKYFQVGTVVDSPVDFYHARIPKKERKKTIVEELLADAEFRRYNKRKYQEIIAEKAALAAGKKNRKKKKFHK